MFNTIKLKKYKTKFFTKNISPKTTLKFAFSFTCLIIHPFFLSVKANLIKHRSIKKFGTRQTKV